MALSTTHQQRLVRFSVAHSQTQPPTGGGAGAFKMVESGGLPALIFSDDETLSNIRDSPSGHLNGGVIINPALQPDSSGSDGAVGVSLADTGMGVSGFNSSQEPKFPSTTAYFDESTEHLMYSPIPNRQQQFEHYEFGDDDIDDAQIDEGQFEYYYTDPQQPHSDSERLGHSISFEHQEFDDSSLQNSFSSLERGRRELMEDMISDAKTYGLQMGPYFEYRFIQQQQHQQQQQFPQHPQYSPPDLNQQFTHPSMSSSSFGHCEPVYGNPFSYNLHTIFEESENELSPLSSLDSMHHQRFHGVKMEHKSENFSEISFTSSSDDDDETAMTSELNATQKMRRSKNKVHHNRRDGRDQRRLDDEEEEEEVSEDERSNSYGDRNGVDSDNANHGKKNSSRLEEYFINSLLDNPQAVVASMAEPVHQRFAQTGVAPTCTPITTATTTINGNTATLSNSLKSAQTTAERLFDFAEGSVTKQPQSQPQKLSVANLTEPPTGDVSCRTQLKNVIEMLWQAPTRESLERTQQCIRLFNAQFRVDWLRIVCNILTRSVFISNCSISVLVVRHCRHRSPTPTTTEGVDNQTRHYLTEYQCLAIGRHARLDSSIFHQQLTFATSTHRRAQSTITASDAPIDVKTDLPPKPPKRLNQGKVTISGRGPLSIDQKLPPRANAAFRHPRDSQTSSVVHRTVLTINGAHRYPVAPYEEDTFDGGRDELPPTSFRLQTNPLNRSFLLKTRNSNELGAELSQPILQLSSDHVGNGTLRTSKSLRAPKHESASSVSAANGTWNSLYGGSMRLFKAVSFGKAGKRPTERTHTAAPQKRSSSSERASTTNGHSSTNKSHKAALFLSEPNLNKRQGRAHEPTTTTTTTSRVLGSNSVERLEKSTAPPPHQKTVTVGSTDLQSLSLENGPSIPVSTTPSSLPSHKPDLILKSFEKNAATVADQSERRQRRNASFYSLSELAEPFTGDCLLSLAMNPRNNSLDLDVHECRYRPEHLTKSHSSLSGMQLYIKCYLLPDPAKTSKRKTRTVKVSAPTTNELTGAKSVIAKFSETLRFSGIAGKRLWISLWNSDRFGRNTPLGELLMDPLDGGRLIREAQYYAFSSPNRSIESDYATIKPKRGVANEKFSTTLSSPLGQCSGSIFLATQFKSEYPNEIACEGTLQILLKEAQNLAVSGTNGLGSIMCKISLVGEKKKNKIRVPLKAPLECLVNPRWNTTVEFPEILLRELQEKTLEISLWFQTDVSSNRKSHFIGAVRLSINEKEKRQDKTSVLRLAAAYIRLKKLQPKPNINTKGANILTDFVDSVPGFVLISNCRGKILFVTPGIEKQLGHQDNEVIGHSLDNFLHPDDIEEVSQLINRALRDEIMQGATRSSEMNFVCHLKEKNQSRAEVSYRKVRVSGHITADFTHDQLFDDVKPQFSPQFSQSKPSANGKNIAFAEETEFYRNGGLLTPANFQKLAHVANDLIFLGHVEEIHCMPDNQLRLSHANFDEYITRHSLDGTLLYADHRIAGVLGFLPKEVSGKSAYDYILPEDYSIALFAHKLMLSSSNGNGVVVHRLHGLDNSVVFLQTMGCLKFNENGLIDHFACVSRLMKESDGEREIEMFVNRFTPHIQDKSALELYESMQMVINPYSSASFADLATAPDAKRPAHMFKSERKRLLPARFERFARDQHQALVRQRSQTCASSPCHSSQNQIISAKIQEPDNEQILKVAVANSKVTGGDTEMVALQNKLTLQESIRNLNEKSEFLMVKTQHHARQNGRKRAMTTTSEIEVGKKGKLSNPNNTFIRSFISAEKSLKKQNKNNQMMYKSLEEEHEEAHLHKSNSVSGMASLPESKYKIAHGQADYTHMLGARVYTYNHLQNANVLSIYTPPNALEAQQRGTLIQDAASVYHSSNVSTPSPNVWPLPPPSQPSMYSFGAFGNNPYSHLNMASEQAALNSANKSPYDNRPSSSSQATPPSTSGTPEMAASLCEEVESVNIGCHLDAMQQANNTVGNGSSPSVNFHLHHHHHMNRPPSHPAQFRSSSRSSCSYEYSPPNQLLPGAEESFSQEENSQEMVDYLSHIEPNMIFPLKNCADGSIQDGSSGSSYSHRASLDSNSGLNTASFRHDGNGRSSGASNNPSYPSSGQTNSSNYSSNGCYNFSSSTSSTSDHGFSKPMLTKKIHENGLHSRYNTHSHPNDHGVITMSGISANAQTNAINYDSEIDYSYEDGPMLLDMELPKQNMSGLLFTLNQPENSYDFSGYVGSKSYPTQQDQAFFNTKSRESDSTEEQFTRVPTPAKRLQPVNSPDLNVLLPTPATLAPPTAQTTTMFVDSVPISPTTSEERL